MQTVLAKKLHQYLKYNNPDVLTGLEESGAVTGYIDMKVEGIATLQEELKQEGKPSYIIEELCMEELTKDFRPSKYNYICDILDECFEYAFQQFQKSGTLEYEAVNMIEYCAPVFESFGFSEATEDNRQLKNAITGMINEYLIR